MNDPNGREQSKWGDIAIIGAGLTGATAFGRLRSARFHPELFEKARGLGGRLSNRRVSSGFPEESVRVELGAPFFSVRDAGFLSLCRGLPALQEFSPRDGVIAFSSADPARTGLSDLVKACLGEVGRSPLGKPSSSPCDPVIHLQTRVTRLERVGREPGFKLYWQTVESDVTTATNQVRLFRKVILTAPFEQALELVAPLDSSDTASDAAFGRLEQSRGPLYSSCQRVSFLLPGAHCPLPGAPIPRELCFEAPHPFERVVVQSLGSGVSEAGGSPSASSSEPSACLVGVFGREEWSLGARALSDEDLFEEVRRELIRLHLLLPVAQPFSRIRHFWRYSQPLHEGAVPLASPVLELLPGLWWAGSIEAGEFGVESAFLAGQLMAKRLCESV